MVRLVLNAVIGIYHFTLRHSNAKPVIYNCYISKGCTLKVALIALTITYNSNKTVISGTAAVEISEYAYC